MDATTNEQCCSRVPQLSAVDEDNDKDNEVLKSSPAAGLIAPTFRGSFLILHVELMSSLPKLLNREN